ncbi:tRNA (adenosine(37)-N6)-threonylcarbamoyltransferase complex dimerization subunit type 1 TsaB [Canibacter sp. lx-45]|uniref:tRNA (adenosine(37)-N6)-threonylcarbamoyltransferase complex dimerization subunit type 1 TsaB n=1 Tax=Canibacter zhuwentaonis TaxID=2837491 RepID=UPI001BDD9A4D|nr:tRNA (adenosine(37)-N6)-threonylcarbamoyltransferase complex dimerization subunit type 1 TsaB [Canibacter zhuwentaonis]
MIVQSEISGEALPELALPTEILGLVSINTATRLRAEPALLAIDTSLGTVVSLSCGVKVWQSVSDNAMAHAEVVGEVIRHALAKAELTVSDIDAVVMGTGPGSFTGLRVGMAAAAAFAIGLAKPLLPVLSHEASAIEFFNSNPAASTVRIVQDARRKELFVTGYTAPQALLPVNTVAPAVIARAEFTAAGSDHTPTRVSGSGLLQAALVRLAYGLEFGSKQPVYLRDPDVRQPVPVKSVFQR